MLGRLAVPLCLILSSACVPAPTISLHGPYEGRLLADTAGEQVVNLEARGEDIRVSFGPPRNCAIEAIRVGRDIDGAVFEPRSRTSRSWCEQLAQQGDLTLHIYPAADRHALLKFFLDRHFVESADLAPVDRDSIGPQDRIRVPDRSEELSNE